MTCKGGSADGFMEKKLKGEGGGDSVAPCRGEGGGAGPDRRAAVAEF
jgi:hypothetical protein